MGHLKRILNPYEELADERLREACSHNHARVFSKVRLADVFPITGSGISADQYRFALQSHFDFVVTDSQHLPLFAVEYDGKSHQAEEQQIRDAAKNSLCEKFGLPILRINANYLWRLYRGMDLLSWFIEVWFCWEGYKRAIETGELPPDEAFWPGAVIRIEGNNRLFPLWLSRPVRAQIGKLWREGVVIDYSPQEIIVQCASGVYRAIAYVGLSANSGVIAQTAMRSQQFPIGDVVAGEAEAIGEIVILELYQRLEAVLAGEEKAGQKAEFIREARHLLHDCRLVRGMYSIEEIGH